VSTASSWRIAFDRGLGSLAAEVQKMAGVMPPSSVGTPPSPPR
jgi:hypothetical protein